MANIGAPPPPEHEILIEFAQVGSIVRVTAIDVETGTEIVFQAPANHPQSSLKRVAAQKMRYVLRKGKA